MRKFNLLCLGVLAGATLAGCSDDALRYDNAQTEDYVKNFIERFGVPDPNHTFSEARRNKLTITSDNPTDVKIAAVVGRKEYLFAETRALCGTKDLYFDIPQGIDEVKVYANGCVFFAKPGDAVNVDPSRVQKVSSRGDIESRGDLTSFKKLKTLTKFANQDETVEYVRLTGATVTEKYGALSPDSTAAANNHFNISSGKNYWRSHDGNMPATLMKQLVNTDPSNTTFYSEDNGFVKEKLYRRGWTNPSLYIHYIRKDYDFEMGLMVGSRSTLSSSQYWYMIPMFGTKNNLPYKNQVLERVQTEAEAYETIDGEKVVNIHKRGAEMRIYFNNDNPENPERNVVLRPSSTQGNGASYYWEFSEDKDQNYSGLKKAILKMAKYYEKDAEGNRPLPLPADLQGGLTKDQLPSGYTGPEIPSYDGDQPTIEFYQAYNSYLSYCAHQLAGYDELLGLKEWFSSHHFLFDENDIPEITPVRSPQTGEIIEGAYDITYRMAKYATGYKECTYSTDTRYTTLPENDKYTIYAGLYGGMSLPSQWSGNEYVYYVIDKDGIHTSYNEDILYKKKRNVTLSVLGEEDSEKNPMLSPGSQADRIFDIDKDGIPEIIFSENTTGSGPNSIIDPFMWILACEDLGAAEDFDFNDIVVSLKYRASDGNVDEEYVDIFPLAAGGIYPAYLMYNEKLIDTDGNPTAENTYFMGPEIHKWLAGDGASYTEMLNTGEYDTENTIENYSKAVRYNYPYEMSGKNGFSMAMNTAKIGNQPNSDLQGSYAGFWILVDKNNVLEGTDLVPQGREYKSVKLSDLEGKGLTMVMNKIEAGFGSGSSIPMMLVLSPYWEWPSERSHIEKAYQSFGDWITDREIHWYGIRTDDDHFPTDIDRNFITKRASITKLMKDIENEDNNADNPSIEE